MDVWHPDLEQVIEDTRKIEDCSKILLSYFEMKNFTPDTIKSCLGDLIIICNVLCDYCDILQKTVDEERNKPNPNYMRVGNFEYYITRCRSIYNKIAVQLNYDRDKALEKCLHKKQEVQKNDDVGEEALILASKKRKKL